MITAPLPRASSSGTVRLSMIIPRYYGLTTRIMVTIKKRAGVIPYSFSSSIAILSSLFSCISRVDILEMA